MSIEWSQPYLRSDHVLGSAFPRLLPKRPLYRVVVLGMVALVISSCSHAPQNVALSHFETTVSAWKDGKVAAYLLAFDDNLPSQLENAVPELNARNLKGTFYVVPGSASWAVDEAKWVDASKSQNIELANHTFSHQGVSDVRNLDDELARANDVLYQVYADRRPPFLLGWGKPGGVPWNVTDSEQSAALESHNLVDRPQFNGSPVNYSSQTELLDSVDKAIETGGMGHNDMHGIGGDYLVTPKEWFIALLDKLQAESDRLWVPDIVSYVQYVTERQTAQVALLGADDDEARLALTSRADPLLYNYPLTLVTKVPEAWSKATVTQGSTTIEVSVVAGLAMYEARPSAGEIRVERSCCG